MIKLSKQFGEINKKISPEYILQKNPGMQRIAKEVKLAVTRAGRAGADSMRDTILNDASTGSNWHSRRNKERAERPGVGSQSVTNTMNSRIETGNMYNSVRYKRGFSITGADKRFRQDVSGGFGWPATKDGQIKDAPSSPIAGSREPDTKNWRSDPRYFEIQEYGNKGMGSQKRAYGVAQAKLKEELDKIKRK